MSQCVLYSCVVVQLMWMYSFCSRPLQGPNIITDLLSVGYKSQSVIFCVHCFNILFLLAFTYSCFLCDSAAIMWCETLLYRTIPYFHIHISVSSHLKLTCCMVNADFVLHPTLGDSSVAMLYSSLCSLLVLGDDLSHIDRTAVCETLRHLQEQFDRSGC